MYSFLLTCLLDALAGCSLPRIFSRIPTVIHHPMPEMAIDYKPFLDIGCPGEEGSLQRCEADSQPAAMKCDMLYRPSDYLGGLDPAMPIALCIVAPFEHEDPEAYLAEIEEGGHMYTYGCLIGWRMRYVVMDDGMLRLIKNHIDLKNTFAPIDTAEDALSFAVAATGYSPYYAIDPDPRYRYYVSELEDTHVVETTEGYEVNLYGYQLWGCGPHPTFPA